MSTTIVPAFHVFALAVADRRRLLVLAVVAVFVLVALMLAHGGDVDARSRTIHHCLRGDEPCNTPVPTPSPR